MAAHQNTPCWILIAPFVLMLQNIKAEAICSRWHVCMYVCLGTLSCQPCQRGGNQRRNRNGSMASCKYLPNSLLRMLSMVNWNCNMKPRRALCKMTPVSWQVKIYKSNKITAMQDLCNMVFSTVTCTSARGKTWSVQFLMRTLRQFEVCSAQE